MRRLHRATGLFPLGAYLAFHAWEHGPVRVGRDALFARLAHTESAPLEIALVLVPLVVHAALGLRLAREPCADSGYPSPAFRRLQVASGIVAGLFLAHHLVGVWLPRVTEPSARGAAYDAMLDHVARAPGVAIYAVGLGAVCTHLGQGVGLALVRRLPRAPRLARALGVALGVLLWLTFLDALAAYATYAPLL